MAPRTVLSMASQPVHQGPSQPAGEAHERVPAPGVLKVAQDKALAVAGVDAPLQSSWLIQLEHLQVTIAHTRH